VLLALGGCKIVEFAELGDYFVRRLLYVSEGSPLATDPRFLLDKAISYVGADCPREKFRKFRATLHPDQSTELQSIRRGHLPYEYMSGTYWTFVSEIN